MTINIEDIILKKNYEENKIEEELENQSDYNIKNEKKINYKNSKSPQKRNFSTYFETDVNENIELTIERSNNKY